MPFVSNSPASPRDLACDVLMADSLQTHDVLGRRPARLLGRLAFRKVGRIAVKGKGDSMPKS